MRDDVMRDDAMRGRASRDDGKSEEGTHDEPSVVRAFVDRPRRPRWLASLADPRRRPAFLDRLNHCRDLDARYARLLRPGVDVFALLRSRGAPPTCYVISAHRAIDGRRLPLCDAVRAAEAGGWGTLISCVNGRLAYYYDECGERRMLLERLLT